MISEPPWRIVLFSTILPAALGLDGLARACGHETVALLTPRLRADAAEEYEQRWRALVAGARHTSTSASSRRRRGSPASYGPTSPIWRCVSAAGRFPAEFSELDLSQPARVVHRHVGSWRFMFLHEGERGPLAVLDGERVRILRTTLTDPGTRARCLDCADGPLCGRVRGGRPLRRPLSS